MKMYVEVDNFLVMRVILRHCSKLKGHISPISMLEHLHTGRLSSLIQDLTIQPSLAKGVDVERK